MNYRHIGDMDEFHKHDVGQNKKEIQVYEYNYINFKKQVKHFVCNV